MSCRPCQWHPQMLHEYRLTSTGFIKPASDADVSACPCAGQALECIGQSAIIGDFTKSQGWCGICGWVLRHCSPSICGRWCQGLCGRVGCSQLRRCCVRIRKTIQPGCQLTASVYRAFCMCVFPCHSCRIMQSIKSTGCLAECFHGSLPLNRKSEPFMVGPPTQMSPVQCLPSASPYSPGMRS